jgi:hypothetical protein
MTSLVIYGRHHEIDGIPEVSFPRVTKEHLRFPGTVFANGIDLIAGGTAHLDGRSQTVRHHFSLPALRMKDPGRGKGGNV